MYSPKVCKNKYITFPFEFHNFLQFLLDIKVSQIHDFVYNIGLTYNASKLVDYSNVNIASDESTTIINNSSDTKAMVLHSSLATGVVELTGLG